MKVIAATANPDKLREISSILQISGKDIGEDFEVIPRPADLPETEETGSTLEANAILKAEHVLEAVTEDDTLIKDINKDTFILADDTGLEVSALGGLPGVRTARFAGENATYAENIAKLLNDLGDEENRSARFATVISAIFLDGRRLIARGEVEGQIAKQPKGQGGFGYDPIFIPNEGTKKGESNAQTFAEMSATQKDSLSHRARALQALIQKINF